MTDAAANVTHSYAYTSFGEVIAANEANFNPYRYNGQYGVQYDAPNRIFMRARYANPTTGRFISEDPIWATNLYPYANNNPVNKVDPKGLWASAEGSPFGLIDNHADIFRGAVGQNMSKENMQSVIAGSNYADRPQFQTRDRAFMHGMISSEKNRDRDIKRFHQFIAKMEYLFITTKDEKTAYFFLGVALHAISDRYSPEHGFRVWNPNDIKGKVAHGLGETAAFSPKNYQFMYQDIQIRVSTLIAKRFQH